MLNVSFTELVLLVAIALIILGPDKLLSGLNRLLSQYRNLKISLIKIQQDIENEVELIDLKQRIHHEIENIRASEQRLEQRLQQIQYDMTWIQQQEQQDISWPASLFFRPPLRLIVENLVYIPYQINYVKVLNLHQAEAA
ncbi:hypothetical protein [Acinetobacter larvae]|uniref:Twin arginine-targeting protein translocase TatB n=1 Tax=Acinetobacter larvae TaxID=1789224 RepID=A0A1B2LZP2_9GAMM|nr:hypothetical protein [Acinetobacter larvae]AOA58379.1 hypothetical protein BFG52_08440 [Acinetobacter larvae]